MSEFNISGARRLALLGCAVAGLGFALPLQGQGCREIFGSLTSTTVAVQTLEWPGLAHPGLLYGGADAVGSRRCLGEGSDSAASGTFRLLPARLDAEYRSTYPFDRNNGLLWAGRGLSAATSGGFVVSQGPLRLTVYPTIAYQQNADVRIVPSKLPGSVYRYPYREVDWPQRFGEAAFWSVGPGQTEVQATGHGLLVSAGTENLWWGPAERYPILLSSTAPGFPHLELGTSHPARVGIGAAEVHLVWGRLDESPYFDSDPADDHRLLTMVSVGFEPDLLPGLSLGANLLQHHTWDHPLTEAAKVLILQTKSNTPTNAIASLVAEWRFLESGARVYAEWAREDYFLDFEDLVTEIDHSQGYLLGLEKLVAISPAARWRLRWELTRLARANTQSNRDPRPTFYEHGRINQGHSNDGQLLGAAIGPGSNAQFLALDRANGRWMAGGYLERIRHDDDTYEDRFATTYGFRGHDIELTLGAYGVGGVGPLTLQLDLSASRRKNRNFLDLDGVNWSFYRESNVALALSAWWSPSR
jgi:hypothetical protein